MVSVGIIQFGAESQVERILMVFAALVGVGPIWCFTWELNDTHGFDGITSIRLSTAQYPHRIVRHVAREMLS